MSLQSKSKIGSGGRSHHSRFFLVRCFVIFLFSSLAVRLVYVQGVLRSDLQQRANRQFSNKSKLTNSRAKIIDINKSVLSETVQIYSCFVDPSLMEDKPRVARRLAVVLGLNEPTLLQKIRNTQGSFLWVKRNVPPSVVAQLKEEKLSGIGFKPELRRNYPMGPLASHLLGMVGIDGHGLSGIERNFEQNLNLLDVPSINKNNRVIIGDVQLTIDASIQKTVERELSWGVEKTGAKKGYVIVQNPKTGDILAAASWPPVSLDPENPPDPQDLRIPVIVDSFEPGSTFKVVTAAAALDEKLVSEKELFSGENGKWKVMDITIHDHEPQKNMSFDDIFIHSSNIGTAKLAERIGSTRLYQYSRLFGFGAFPASGLPGESKGVLRVPSAWSGVSKFTISFGQELCVTPLQLVGAYSSIANGGILMEPRFIHGILSSDGKNIETKEITPVRRVMSEETAKRLSDVLVKVVEKGTGVNAQIQWDRTIRVAGKTGTAQKFNTKKGRYDDILSMISFCGFFPADNPQFTIVVLLDEPEGRRWGGLDAAPVFRRIAEYLSPRLQKPNADSQQKKWFKNWI